MTLKFMRRVSAREWAIRPFVIVKNKLMSVFLCVCPVIDHEFRHNIVKVAVDPRGESLVDPHADYFDNVTTKFIVNNRTEENVLRYI